MEQRKILDQYLRSGKVSARSIQGSRVFKSKNFNQKLERKVSKFVTLTSRLVKGGMVQH